MGYKSDLKTDDNGSLLATAEDLGIFIRALNDGSVFKDKKNKKSIRQYISMSTRV